MFRILIIAAIVWFIVRIFRNSKKTKIGKTANHDGEKKKINRYGGKDVEDADFKDLD